MPEERPAGGIVARIRSDLRTAADPARAPQMQRYMRSAMPFLGVGVPQVRALVRARAQESPPTTLAALEADVRALWHGARFREERYAATALLDVPAARPLRAPTLIALHEELIVAGAWWDHVDELAHRVGELLRAFRPEITPVVRAWQRSPDRWLRRTSVICQLDARGDTDLDLLAAAVRANAGDEDFFLRKAIG